MNELFIPPEGTVRRAPKSAHSGNAEEAPKRRTAGGPPAAATVTADNPL